VHSLRSCTRWNFGLRLRPRRRLRAQVPPRAPQRFRPALANRRRRARSR
jgi:hypothetical protein